MGTAECGMFQNVFRLDDQLAKEVLLAFHVSAKHVLKEGTRWSSAAEQVVAADGSCASLGHAACDQFRIILYGKGKIG